MRMFLRQTTIGREPLAIAMSGVRMGERVLQIGVDDPAVAGLLASKPGLSGTSTLVVADGATAATARRAIDRVGAPADVHVRPPGNLPFDNDSFDLVVVHNRHRQWVSGDEGQRALVLEECRRVLRSGGRLVVFDRGRVSAISALFQRSSESVDPELTGRVLEAAGFKAVRLLGDREGYRFTEALNVKGGGAE